MEQIEDELLSAGNKKIGESIVAGMLVSPRDKNALYDKDAKWKTGEGKSSGNP